MNGNKFATSQIVKEPVEVLKGRIFSWLSSKASWTLICKATSGRFSPFHCFTYLCHEDLFPHWSTLCQWMCLLWRDSTSRETDQLIWPLHLIEAFLGSRIFVVDPPHEWRGAFERFDWWVAHGLIEWPPHYYSSGARRAGTIKERGEPRTGC